MKTTYQLLIILFLSAILASCSKVCGCAEPTLTNDYFLGKWKLYNMVIEPNSKFQTKEKIVVLDSTYIFNQDSSYSINGKVKGNKWSYMDRRLYFGDSSVAVTVSEKHFYLTVERDIFDDSSSVKKYNFFR